MAAYHDRVEQLKARIRELEAECRDWQRDFETLATAHGLTMAQAVLVVSQAPK